MAEPLDLLRLLPPFKFRGIQVPVVDRERHHEHEMAKHVLQYRDKQLVETTGGDNWVYTYTLAFRNGISIAAYRSKGLFTVLLPQFLAAYENKERGELEDPLWGKINVKPMSWDEVMDLTRRDGIDVKISFIEDPDEDESQGARTGISTLSGALAEARNLDAELSVTFREQEEPPGATTDPFSAAAGVGAQLNRNRQKVSGSLADASHKLEKIERELEKMESPQHTANEKRQTRRLRLAAHKLDERVQRPDRTLQVIQTQERKSILELAKEFGMAVEDFRNLNPALDKLSYVAPGINIIIKQIT